ncbi:MAG: GspL/Epsl periplasmic domain-containing protein, partial [Perlucidibaca sp.]
VFIQAEPGQAALIHPADASLLFSQMLSQRQLSTPVRLRHPQGATLPSLPAGLQPSPAPWQDWADLLKTQSPGLWLRHPQNWLTGVLQPDNRPAWSPLWKLALALLVLLALVQTLADRYEAYRLSQQADAAQAEAAQLYRQWFPGERMPADLGKAFESRLAGASRLGPDQLLQLLAQTAPGPQWQVQKLDFRDGGEASVDVQGGADLGEAQRWVSNLGELGLPASLQNARLEAGQARARIILTTAGKR